MYLDNLQGIFHEFINHWEKEKYAAQEIWCCPLALNLFSHYPQLNPDLWKISAKIAQSYTMYDKVLDCLFKAPSLRDVFKAQFMTVFTAGCV